MREALTGTWHTDIKIGPIAAAQHADTAEHERANAVIAKPAGEQAPPEASMPIAH
jgi:hypothetical protein